MSSGKVGLVGLWDAIAFDEVADLQEQVEGGRDHPQDIFRVGSFARGMESLTGNAFIAMFLNTKPIR